MNPLQQSNSTGWKSRVFVVDDHPIVRQGLTLMINAEKDLIVCGEAEETKAALCALAENKPDILIVDISLNGPDGLELLKNARTLFPDLPILILSMHDEATYAERALRARANGYIMKQEATEKVLIAIRRILNGEVYLSERMSNKVLLQYIGGAAAGGESRIADLSDRELEVFRLIGDGYGTRKIAEQLHLSIKTVETYQAHIKEKLLLRSGRELVQQAISWKLSQERPAA